MQTVLIVIHLLVVVALVIVVLLQRSEGGALGVGGGGGFMTGRGQANVLTRATAILATIFFLTSLGLTLFARYGHQNRLNFDVPAAGPAQQAPATLPPKGQGSVLDQVRAIEQQRNGSGGPAAATGSTAKPAPSAAPSGTKSTTGAGAPATPAEPSGMPARTAPNAPLPSSQSPASQSPASQAPAAPATQPH